MTKDIIDFDRNTMHTFITFIDNKTVWTDDWLVVPQVKMVHDVVPGMFEHSAVDGGVTGCIIAPYTWCQ